MSNESKKNICDKCEREVFGILHKFTEDADKIMSNDVHTYYLCTDCYIRYTGEKSYLYAEIMKSHRRYDEITEMIKSTQVGLQNVFNEFKKFNKQEILSLQDEQLK